MAKAASDLHALLDGVSGEDLRADDDLRARKTEAAEVILATAKSGMDTDRDGLMAALFLGRAA